jgi:DNA-binding CsgD family transcriptional regulator
MFPSLRTNKGIRLLLLVTLVANLIFLVIDISDDIHEHMGLHHLLPELLTVFGTIVLVIALADTLLQQRQHNVRLQSRIGELEGEVENWRQRTANHVQGLSLAIDEQFSAWGLTSAEKEIALLLLKGLSNKEIAEVRQTSEHTVKQQSSAVYRKSALSTRSELSAFFLEDLLAPRSLAQDQAPVGVYASLASPASGNASAASSPLSH